MTIQPLNPFQDTLPGIKPKSPILSKFIEFLADINLTNEDVDDKMMEAFPHLVDEGWKRGTTRQKLNMYPALARTAAEARVLLWRELGRSKIDGYRVISDALEAEKVSVDGATAPDHKIRLEAADRFLSLTGENASPAGARVNVTIGGGDNKIMIMSSDGKALPFPTREAIEESDGD